MRKTITLFALALSLLAAAPLIAKLMQCPKCGYEYESGTPTCAHCGKELPAEKKDAPPPAAAKAAVTAEIMDVEIGGVLRAQRNEHPALTILRARNTLALLKIAPESVRPRAADVLSAVTGAEKKLRDTEQPCFACRGTGQRVYGMTDMKGNVTYQQAAPGTVGCPVCNGAGKLGARASQNTIIAMFSEARQAYERAQEARGWEEFGGVWLPKGVAAGLDLHQKAALKTAGSQYCRTCHGFGFFGCAVCDGQGKLKCSNTKCVQGRETCPTCSGKKKVTESTGNRSIERTCPNCSGKGVALCATCEGKAWLECTKCESTGQTRCATCKGTAEQAACTKCDGTGIAVCRSCRGAGQYRGAPCDACKGEKETLCSSCNGAGHRVR